MTNFDFLTKDKQFETFSGVAVAAEKTLHIDLSTCIINCRRAMEMAVKWMYSVDGSLGEPYDERLVSLMNNEDFRDIVGNDIWRRMKLIRELGNNAAHEGKKFSVEQATLCLENLRHIFRGIDEILYAIDEVGSDRLAVCLDTGHLNLTKTGTQRDFILKAGKRLRALHIANNDGKEDRHLAPFTGSVGIDFTEVVDALREINYNGLFIKD